MTRFFFHLFDERTTLDEEGIELPDLNAAIRQARRGAAELIAERVQAGDRLDPSHRFDIEDDQHRKVYSLAFSTFVEC